MTFTYHIVYIKQKYILHSKSVTLEFTYHIVYIKRNGYNESEKLYSLFTYHIVYIKQNLETIEGLSSKNSHIT